MGTEAAWVPFVVAALGAGVNEVNTRRTARKKDRDLAQGIRKNSETQRQANQVINQNIDKLSESTSAPFKESLQGQFIDRMNKSRQQAFAGLDTPGDTSQAFKDASGQAKAGAIDYGAAISSLLAVMARILEHTAMSP